MAGLYRLETMAPLAATDEAGNAVGKPTLGRVKIALPADAAAEAPAPTHAPDGAANLDNRVRLLGYDLPDDPVAPGQTVPLTLYWQVLGPVGGDYQVFVHLAAADETLAGRATGRR